VECDRATAAFATVLGVTFDATVLVAVLEAAVLCAGALDALVLAACDFAMLEWLPELVWARAGPVAGRPIRAAMRQMRIAVFQVKFRAMYFASPRDSFVLLPSFASCFGPFACSATLSTIQCNKSLLGHPVRPTPNT
jgi:hypothetical protein